MASALRCDRRRVIADRLPRPCSEQLRMQIVALVLRRLVFLYLDAVGVGLGVLANAGHLLGTFPVRLVGANAELVVAELGGDDGLRGVQSRSVDRSSGSALRNHLSERLKDHGVTVKLAALVAVPPAVAIVIFPVTAPVGTVAVTCVSEFTVNVVAFTPPKLTLVA